MNNPMSAFVDVDFDCEFLGLRLQWVGGLSRICGQEPIYYDMDADSYRACRPRLNKKQIMDDYTPILVEGLVWEAYVEYDFGGMDWIGETKTIESKALSLWLNADPELRSIAHIAFKGVQQGNGLSEWAKANDVPILSDNMDLINEGD